MNKEAIIKAITGLLDYATSEGIDVACNDSSFHDFARNLDPSDIEGLKIDPRDMVNELIKSPEFLDALTANIGSIMFELLYALRTQHGVEDEG